MSQFTEALLKTGAELYHDRNTALVPSKDNAAKTATLIMANFLWAGATHLEVEVFGVFLGQIAEQLRKASHAAANTYVQSQEDVKSYPLAKLSMRKPVLLYDYESWAPYAAKKAELEEKRKELAAVSAPFELEITGLEAQLKALATEVEAKALATATVKTPSDFSITLL